jgi:RNA polymerase sigma-70 factor, ECF subfamily
MDTHGNKAGFGQAALEHLDALYGYAMTLTRDTTEAEELVQETYLRAANAANGPNGHEMQESPHVVYIRKLEREQVREAIESLPDAYREIVVLRDIEGFTYQEIAMVLNCPAGTVMSRLGRARGKLRKVLSTWQTRTRIRAV